MHTILHNFIIIIRSDSICFGVSCVCVCVDFRVCVFVGYEATCLLVSAIQCECVCVCVMLCINLCNDVHLTVRFSLYIVPRWSYAIDRTLKSKN